MHGKTYLSTSCTHSQHGDKSGHAHSYSTYMNKTAVLWRGLATVLMDDFIPTALHI